MNRPECNEAIQRGWSIVPVNVERVSMVKWKILQKRKATPQELSDWEGMGDLRGWAVVTGALSGLVILDFDGVRGRDLLARYGLKPHVRTRSGGLHVYVKHPGWWVKTFKTEKKKDLPFEGLDVRGDGGYAVFTGENFKLDPGFKPPEDGFENGKYHVLRPLDELEDPAALPADIKAYCGLDGPSKPQEKPIPPKVKRVMEENRRDDRVATAVLLNDAQRLVGSGHGRNDSGFWLAGQLRDNQYDLVEAMRVMKEFCDWCPNTNTKGEKQPYKWAECLASLHSAYNAPAREPWGPSQHSRPQDYAYADAPPPGAAPPPAVDENLGKAEFVNKPEGPEDGVRQRLSYGDKGVRPHVENLCLIMEHDTRWRGVLALNEMTQRPYVRGAVPWGAGHRHWKDTDDVELERWLIRNYGLFQTEVIRRGVEAIAAANAFHPVRDYLTAMKWDGEPRLNSWLATYCGVEQSDYTAAVGRCWLMSACARVFEPGCKADYMLVLEGEQGLRKTEVAVTLGGEWFRPFFFSRDLADREAGMKLMGAWILEFTELRAFQGSNEESVKGFLTNRTDPIRMPWGRYTIDVLRSCVFIGTTNRDDYGFDPTGNRRLWPVEVTKVELEALKRDRDQLWAEACFYYQEGQHWWIEDEAVIAEAKRRQRARHSAEPIWEEVLHKWLIEALTGGAKSVTMKQIFDGPLTFEPSHPGNMRRAARVLISLGWERDRKENGRSWVPKDRDKFLES